MSNYPNVYVCWGCGKEYPIKNIKVNWLSNESKKVKCTHCGDNVITNTGKVQSRYNPDLEKENE